MYDVPLIGGHLTLHDGSPALSAFGVGVLSGPYCLRRTWQPVNR